jgi:hypothetical protein
MKFWKKNPLEAEEFRDWYIWAKPTIEIMLTNPYSGWRWIQKYAWFPTKTADKGWLWRKKYWKLVEIFEGNYARIVVQHKTSVSINKPPIHPMNGAPLDFGRRRDQNIRNRTCHRCGTLNLVDLMANNDDTLCADCFQHHLRNEGPTETHVLTDRRSQRRGPPRR